MESHTAVLLSSGAFHHPVLWSFGSNLANSCGFGWGYCASNVYHSYLLADCQLSLVQFKYPKWSSHPKAPHAHDYLHVGSVTGSLQCRLSGERPLHAELYEVRDTIYAECRDTNLAFRDRSLRTSLNKRIALTLQTCLQNNIAVNFLTRLKKWCRAQVSIPFLHVCASQLEPFTIIFDPIDSCPEETLFCLK